ncbi:30S ribosomal protein S17 [Patescibacteria group bacterium]|nr:30S ribosomal protein S17 [Patescibacteria group bacterium]MBU4115737.1 30S ribosomal protein S17 [Patescibacteria group bacterium]
MKKDIQKNNKTLKGKIISDKMKDTVVVLVERYVKHPKYKKYFKKSKKFKAHDFGNKCRIGDSVVIEESKPISKDKSFKIVQIVSKGVSKKIQE